MGTLSTWTWSTIIESEYNADEEPMPPWRIIREDVLAPLGLNVTGAAKVLGVTRQALSNMLNGRTALTAEMVLCVEKAFGPKMEHLMRMQLEFRPLCKPAPVPIACIWKLTGLAALKPPFRSAENFTCK